MRRTTTVVLLATVAVLGLWLWHRSGRVASAPVAEPAQVALDAAQAASGVRGTAGNEAATDSLRGTQVDGGITLDAGGRPVADRDMRRLFDYFLTRLGERSPEQIRRDLLQHLQGKLGADAVARTLVWFDTYVALQRESAALGATEDLAADLHSRQALRRLRLGDTVAEAWFGAEERKAAQALARREVIRDQSLTPAARKARLQAMAAERNATPDAAALQEEGALLAMEMQAQFEAAHTPPAQRFAERAELFGEEAARRLAALDESRAQWRARVNEYRSQRAQVLADRSLSPAQRQSRLDALLATFPPSERQRVQVLADAGNG